MRSSTLLAVLLVALFAISSVRADIYLNSPRGSNNRLDEANRDRTNANRLFNSQVGGVEGQKRMFVQQAADQLQPFRAPL